MKSLFRTVGIKFNRTDLLKALPGVNIPIGLVMNGKATAALGANARAYYRDLPSGRN